MTREVLLVPPMGDNVEAAQRAAELLSAGNVAVRPPRAGVSANVELVLVLGGDGTFLRAADLARAIAFVAETPRGGFIVSMEVQPEAPLSDAPKERQQLKYPEES